MSRSAIIVQRETGMSHVSVAGGDLSGAMRTTRIRLDHPAAFKYAPDADGVVFRVEL
jgi:hypothetical protein